MRGDVRNAVQSILSVDCGVVGVKDRDTVRLNRSAQRLAVHLVKWISGDVDEMPESMADALDDFEYWAEQNPHKV